MKALLVFLSLLSLAAARPALDRPNVIIVFLDDAGFADFAHTGHPSVKTPNLTRLVREGANFPQFYSASPACTASRYGLLTGRNPARSGLGKWVIGPTDARHIHPSEITIAEGLKNAGYATAIFGKWHLGNPNAANSNTANAFPLAHGFDRWLGTNVSHDYTSGGQLLEAPSSANTPISGYRLISQNIATDIALGDSLNQTYTDAAVSFIREKKDQPFFLYFASNLPHLPVRVGNAFKGKSAAGEYGDCIEEIDHHIGTLRATLEEEGIAENTLIVFTSDNGPWIRYQDTASDSLYNEARILIGSALPFRDGKGSTWEGGLRVPGVFWWPGTIPPATYVRQPASSLDILPTVLQLAGQPLPPGRTIDGRDIRSYLSPANFTQPVPEFTFVYTGQPGNDRYAVRKGPWKIHTRLFSQTGNNHGFTATSASPLLFNVETDPSERIDLRAYQPDIVSDLKSSLSAFETSLASEGTFWGAP